LLRDFGLAFNDSGCTSLDAFVEPPRNRRFLPLAKAAIVAKICECEIDDRLFPDTNRADNHVDWFAYLFREYLRTPSESDFRQNQLRVITFNFDRSFERKLFRMLKSAYSLDDPTASELVTAIPVLHIHGRLGGEHWLGERRPDSRPYNPIVSVDQKLALFNDVRIIHEDIDREVLSKAHAWLMAAHTIVFLGFGYHPINVTRLRLNEPHPNATVYGTALGLSEPEVVRAKRTFHDPRIALSRDVDAYHLIRQFSVIPDD